MTIWTPKERLEPVTVYIDESHLHKKSGVIKAAVAIPHGARRAFEEALAPILERRQAAEFKAGRISSRNLKQYDKFLQYLVNIMAETGVQAPLFSLATIESTSAVSSPPFQSVLSMYDTVLKSFESHSDLLHDLAELTLWSLRHLPYIAPEGVANPLELIIDEQFSNARKAAQVRFLKSSIGVAVGQREDQVFPTMLTVAFKTLMKKIPPPNVTRVAFVRSVDCIYVQAADLVANLVYNHFLYLLGVRTENTQLKHELLARVLSGDPPSEEFLTKLKVVEVAPTAYALECHPGLIGRLRFAPDSANATK